MSARQQEPMSKTEAKGLVVRARSSLRVLENGIRANDATEVNEGISDVRDALQTIDVALNGYDGDDSPTRGIRGLGEDPIEPQPELDLPPGHE